MIILIQLLSYDIWKQSLTMATLHLTKSSCFYHPKEILDGISMTSDITMTSSIVVHLATLNYFSWKEHFSDDKFLESFHMSSASSVGSWSIMNTCYRSDWLMNVSYHYNEKWRKREKKTFLLVQIVTTNENFFFFSSMEFSKTVVSGDSPSVSIKIGKNPLFN